MNPGLFVRRNPRPVDSQGRLLADWEATRASDSSERVAFADLLDPAPLAEEIPSLFDLVRRVGPEELGRAGEELRREGQGQWRQLLDSVWRSQDPIPESAQDSHLFFALACLQPIAETLARQRHVDLPRGEPARCAVCGARPLVTVLREEGHGARRSLVCSLCLAEWGARRIVCLAGGEDRFDALPVYTAERFPHVRIEACETCKTYIKTVDLTKDGLAVPEVDELASVSLGLWAEEKGYTKLVRNLLRL